MVLITNCTNPQPYLVVFDSKTKIKLPPELRRYAGDPGYRYIEEVCGKDCHFGDGTLIHAPFKCGDNIRVGDCCVIMQGCTIGNNVVIDDGCQIPPKTVIEDGYHWTLADSYKAFIK